MTEYQLPNRYTVKESGVYAVTGFVRFGPGCEPPPGSVVFDTSTGTPRVMRGPHRHPTRRQWFGAWLRWRTHRPLLSERPDAWGPWLNRRPIYAPKKKA